MRRSCAVGLVVLLAAAARAADWPGFLGPNGDDTSPETHLIRAFPPAGPTVLWTVKLGQGFGSAAVAGGQVFVLDREGKKGDALRCFDLANGKELWTYAYEAPGQVDFGGSRTTPAVDATSVFTVGLFGQVKCIDRAAHTPVWSLDLAKDFGTTIPTWGVALSPVLYKDWLIIAPQSKTVGVAALEKATGKVVWKSAPIGEMLYVTPVITSIDGVTQVVVENGSGAHGVDIATGEVLWSCDFKSQIPVPQPTPIGDGRLFLTSGYGNASAMFKIEHQGNAWKVTELWRHPRVNGGHIQRPLLIDKHLYALCNNNGAKEGLVCLDLDGHELWRTGKAPSLDKGNFIYADGVIWSMDGATGELRIIQPDPTAYKELACGKLLHPSAVWGCMALSDGRLLARDGGELKCVDLRATDK